MTKQEHNWSRYLPTIGALNLLPIYLRAKHKDNSIKPKEWVDNYLRDKYEVHRILRDVQLYAEEHPVTA